MQIDKTTEEALKNILQYVMAPRAYMKEKEQNIRLTEDDILSYEEWSRSRARYLFEKLFNKPNEN